ncbi:hypothetical protein [Nannocystis punicea]|uniref:Uncharacterized protein n=1 Tax=Nannocystis punicea TaxID=2995304 RepID=A0ABY7H2D8_9BACT|nr:hypothetical protein [Nannocystis poenicansa]WAS93418.1 hypothetical protein O0S08_45315 [Nannocystis poenicansa]
MSTANVRAWIAMLSGFAAGMMFVIACPGPDDGTTATAPTGVGSGAQTFGPTTASAATTTGGGGESITCQNWEVRYDPVPDDYGVVVALPAGWEPFAVYNAIHSRRCAD